MLQLLRDHTRALDSIDGDDLLRCVVASRAHLALDQTHTDQVSAVVGMPSRSRPASP